MNRTSTVAGVDVVAPRVLYVTDRLSTLGGADLHLLAVIRSVARAGARVRVAYGHRTTDAVLPPEIECQAVRIRGLASSVVSEHRLQGLDGLLNEADVVHAQNVMNPAALARIVGTGRAVVTVQDHRVFCPGPGKTLPDGGKCRERMSEDVCRQCLRDPGYRRRMVELTSVRADALRGARLVVLSRYMAAELELMGLSGAEVIPPWVETGSRRTEAGEGALLAGRLVHHKAPLDAWNAWRLGARGLPLRVAGAGSFADRLPGADHLGWLPHARFVEELRRARAVLFPAFWQEPFGIVGVEALAQGTPVVVAESGGSDEWSQVGCLVVPAGNVSAMAESLRSLAADRDRALEMGEAGRRSVAARFSESDLLPRLLSAYLEAGGRAGGVSDSVAREPA